MRLDQIDRLPINESYVRRLKEKLGGDTGLVNVYREHGKLTGEPQKDFERIHDMRIMLEDDDFDTRRIKDYKYNWSRNSEARVPSLQVGSRDFEIPRDYQIGL